MSFEDFYNAKDKDGNTALARAAGEGSLDIVKALLAAGADVNGSILPLTRAAFNGRADVVACLLVNGVDVDAEDKDGNTALTLAAGKGLLDIVKVLLAAGADVNGSTFPPLARAAAHRRMDVVAYLLSISGVDVNAEDTHGNSALVYAAGSGYLHIAKALVAAGADVNKSKCPPLARAAANGQTHVVSYLLSISGIDVNAKDKSGNTEGFLKIVKALVVAGANVNGSMCPPLVRAVAHRRANVVSYLLSFEGIDVNAVDKDGNTALENAAGMGYLHIVKALVAAGADVKKSKCPPLVRAAAHRRANVVSYLLTINGIDINAKDEDGNTALFMCPGSGWGVNCHCQGTRRRWRSKFPRLISR